MFVVNKFCVKIYSIGGGGGGLNVTYLWSLYNLGSVGGELLTSFSTYGMVLRGFDWEEDCRLNAEATEISLDLGNITRDCYSVETVLRVALELTSNVSECTVVSADLTFVSFAEKLIYVCDM